MRRRAVGTTRRGKWLGAALLLPWAGGAADAADCTITLSPINFGVYDPIETTANLDLNGNVRVGCILNPLNPFEISFGAQITIRLSQGSSGSYAARTMRQGAASILQYNLYTTAARAIVWGDGSGGTQVVSGAVGGLLSGQPNPRNFPVFGRLPPAQNPAVGAHTDTITVTVMF